MSIRTRVVGGNNLKDELKGLNKEIKEDVFDVIFALSKSEIETKAKQTAPKDTGRLVTSINTFTKNITTYSYRDETGRSFDGRLKSIQPKGYEVFVGTNVEYAIYMHEMGGGGPYSGRTVGGEKRPKGYGRYFLRKAYEAAVPKIVEEIRRIKGIE
jgi:hypothetical protein